MKKTIKQTLGMIFTFLMPKRTAQIKENFFAPYWEEKVAQSRIVRIIENCIRIYLAKKSMDGKQGEELEEIHRKFWQEDMDLSWHEDWVEKFYEEVVPKLQDTLKQLDKFLAANDIENICEIGTGNGEMLALLAERYPKRYNMFGIDVSETAIQKTAENHPHLTFYAGDAKEWILENSRDKTLYLTNHGVFEYFSEASLEKIFRFIHSQQPNSIIAMVCEPVADAHDLNSQSGSILTTKGEYSFSHNHADLIKRSGMSIKHLKENRDLGYRSVTIFASSGQ